MKRYYIRPAKKQQTFLRKTHITMKDRKRRFEILEELDDFDESFMFEEWGQRPAPKSKSALTQKPEATPMPEATPIPASTPTPEQETETDKQNPADQGT